MKKIYGNFICPIGAQYSSCLQGRAAPRCHYETSMRRSDAFRNRKQKPERITPQPLNRIP